MEQTYMQKKVPLFSIITPSYNQGMFIEETIKSVLGQEGDFYIDYMIIDGGSTDETVEIIKKYASLLEKEKWPVKCCGIRYRWVSEKDDGQAHAVNKGWAIAKGEILGWLNSDDTILPGALKEVVKVFVQNPETDIVYGGGFFIDEKNNIIGKFNTERFDRDLFREINYILQPTVFIRKKVIDKIGMLDETLHYSLDYDLWIRASKDFDFLYIDKNLATFRLYKNTKSMGSWINIAREDMNLVKKHYGVVAPPVVYRYIKSIIMAKLNLPLTLATPSILFLSLLKYIQVNRKLPFYSLKAWVNWIKKMYVSNKQNLDFHTWELKKQNYV